MITLTFLFREFPLPFLTFFFGGVGNNSFEIIIHIQFCGFQYIHRLVHYHDKVFNIFMTPPPPRNPILISSQSTSLQANGQSALYGFVRSGHFIEMTSHNIWPFVSGFLHLTRCFQGSSTWKHVLELHVYGQTALHCPEAPFYLFIHQFVDIWGCFSFLTIIHPCTRFCADRCFRFSRADTEERNCWAIWCTSQLRLPQQTP